MSPTIHEVTAAATMIHGRRPPTATRRALRHASTATPAKQPVYAVQPTRESGVAMVVTAPVSSTAWPPSVACPPIGRRQAMLRNFAR
jgi:hypothetical protein